MSDDAADKVDQDSATEAAAHSSAHRVPTVGAPPASHDSTPEDATRFRIGAAASACVAFGVVMLMFSSRSELAAAFLRVGILGLATCLAFPTLQRIRWRPRNGIEKALVTVLLVMMVLRPRIFVPLGLVLGVLLLFKLPTSKQPQDEKEAVPPHKPED